jgi:hypothetical protein
MLMQPKNVAAALRFGPVNIAQLTLKAMTGSELPRVLWRLRRWSRTLPSAPKDPVSALAG